MMRLLTLPELTKEFEAHELIKAIRVLLGSAHNVNTLWDEGKRNIAGARGASIDLFQRCQPMLLELVECCKAADLKMSVLALDNIQVLFRTSSGTLAHLGPENLIDNVWRAIGTVEQELSLRVYFSLDPNETERYSSPWQGWEPIIDRFPDTIRDIEEMNKCFALGRYTASMFHALHVAEWGAASLGDYIGAIDPKRGWVATEKKLRELVKAGHRNLPASLTGKFEFLEQMSREINSMVLAWRHKVDHATNHLAIVPNTEFTPDIAEHIIGAVRIFMLRLIEGMP